MTMIYKSSTDAGVPTLTGAVGSLITLLDYLLVTTLSWTKEYSGTNTASYRPASGNRFYLGVDDTGTLNARVRGFETMTAAGVAVASGTGPFPTDTQLSGGGYICKGPNTSTTSPWWFASDGTLFYLSITVATYPSLFTFGDFESYKAADAYNTMIAAEDNANYYQRGIACTYVGATAQQGSFVTRSHTQLGGSVTSGRTVDSLYGSPTTLGSVGAPYPSTIEGALILGKIRVSEPTTQIRGELPGLWNPAHARPLGDGDSFAGSGDFAGRTFIARNVGSNGQVIVETSDTWRT